MVPELNPEINIPAPTTSKSFRFCNRKKKKKFRNDLCEIEMCSKTFHKLGVNLLNASKH